MMLNDGLDSSLASHWKAADEADDEFIPKPKDNPKRKPKENSTRKPKDKPTPQADPAPAPAPKPYYEEDIYGVSDDEREENTDKADDKFIPKPKEGPTPAPPPADPAPPLAPAAPNPYYDEDIYGVSDDDEQEEEENTDETIPSTSMSGSYVFFETDTVSEGFSGEESRSGDDDLPPPRRRSI